MTTDYRYTLRRILDGPGGQGRLCWVMLNPSTADDVKDDQTIRKVKYFTEREGYDELIVVNLFAIRATDPKALREMGRDHDLLGPGNHAAIREAMAASDGLVCAWGAHSIVRGWSTPEFVRLSARAAGLAPMCLGKTKDGSPRHPCYLPHNTPMEVWH